MDVLVGGRTVGVIDDLASTGGSRKFMFRAWIVEDGHGFELGEKVYVESQRLLDDEFGDDLFMCHSDSGVRDTVPRRALTRFPTIWHRLVDDVDP